MNNQQTNTTPLPNDRSTSGIGPRPTPQANTASQTGTFQKDESLDRALDQMTRAVPVPSTKHHGLSTKPMFRGNRPRMDRPSTGSARPQNRNFGPRLTGQSDSRFEKKNDIIPPLAPGDIRVIPLGGVEEITKNMTIVEMNDQIIIIDAGIQMGDTGPGVQTAIPDTAYLEERKHLIKALVITHGHLDHIGAIPFLIEKIGNPPIYTREFGAILINKRQEEYPHLPPLDIRIAEKEDGAIRLSEDFKVRFFGLTHSIPDSTGVIIETPHGDIVSTGDVRVENLDGIPVQHEVEQYSFFKDRNVLLMTMDSTGITKPGWSLAESIVIRTIDGLIRDTKGRLLIAAFASQVERLIQFMESAKRYGRYVVVEGRSMKMNLAIVKHLNLTNMDHVISVEDMHKYPPNKIMILATGAQGEPYSLLDRVASGTHKFIKMNEHDTLIFSASVVPGNDRVVDDLKDRLYRFNPKVITYADTQVHASGHGCRAELEWIHTQVNYKFFMPIHGSHYRLKMHREIVMEMKGKTRDEIPVPDNGTIIELREKGQKLVVLEARAPHDRIIVDGTYVGPAHEVVLRDRKVMNEEGIFTVIVTLDQRTHALKKSPDISSRGFVYLRDNQDLLHKVRGLAKKIVETDIEAGKQLDISNIKDILSDKIQKFLFQRTGKKPIVTAVIIAI